MKYSIQQVAKQIGITTYAIRYYDDHGLLPAVKRDENNNRVFDEETMGWIKIVTCMRNTGMPIANIKHYIDLCLEGESTVSERYDIMVDQQTRTLEQLQELQGHLDLINRKVKHYATILAEPQPDTIVS